ncbi:MAG: aryl-sulfate sulfotransferase [Bacteroidetes bacterium]|nr:aryl-sulfate sulfotransferase [Bacteroidota bacterium]
MRKETILSFIILWAISINCTKVMSQKWGMYTFYATQNTTQAKLIDTTGTTYKTWALSSSTAYSAYLLPGDTILQTVKYQSGSIGQGGITGKVRKVNWAGTTVWEYAVSDASTQMHHDVCALPNGNVLLVCYETKSASPTTVGCSSTITVWSEKIIEVKPTGATTGTIVWEWHLWDHLCQSVYSSVTSTYVTNVSEHPERMNVNYSIKQDWFHMNGIDYNPQLDQIMISSHALSEIYVIDHSTTTAQAATHTGGNSGKGGDFLYRWGNPATYGLSSTANNSGFNVIHDAHWIPSTNPLYPNYMCVYNNNSGGNVKVAIWNPPYNGYNYTYTAGSIVGPTTVINPTIPSFTASDMGNSQQLGNGNELVCNPGGSVFEVSPNGTTLQTISNAKSVHAYRYELCYVRAPIALASASSTLVTSGTAVTLSSSATSVTESSPTYSYAWTSTSGFTSTQQNPSISPTSNATYTVIITNTAIGCSDTASVTVNITGSSTLTVSATAMPVNVCPGSTVQLNSTPSGGTSYTYQWTSSPAGFTSTLQNPTVVPTSNTSYTVTVTSGSDIATNTTSVILYSSPVTPTISQTGNTMTSSASSGNQWYFNNNIIQGATGNTYTPPQAGSYQVQVTDANGCTSISSAYTPTVGIPENNSLTQKIIIYPNPTQSIINLSIPASINSFETEIINIYGKEVLKNSNQSTLNLSDLSNGIYFIMIKVDGKLVQQSKIVLNK